MAIDVSAPPQAQVHRFTLDEYHRLAEAGGGEGLRVELIEGLIVDLGVKTREHENAIGWLAEWLLLAVDRKRFEVRVCGALTLERSEPEPDLMAIDRDAPRPYHPSTATLVIEVAVSSHDRDLRQKPIVYARAGIEEYWVIDLDARRAIVHRRPVGDRYEQVLTVAADSSIEAVALALPALALAELLAAAER
jgi:Uma2 family endonuclease